jgi:hypothetical protein
MFCNDPLEAFHHRTYVLKSGTSVAPTFEQDFGDFANCGALCAWGRADVDFDADQARYLAAFGAKEVRVFVNVVVFAITRLEPPDVVSQFHSRNQTGFAQLDKIAIDGGAIESKRCEDRGDFRMAERGRGTTKLAEDGQSCGRAPQTGLSDLCAQRLPLGACLSCLHQTAFCPDRKSNAAGLADAAEELRCTVSNGWSK